MGPTVKQILRLVMQRPKITAEQVQQELTAEGYELLPGRTFHEATVNRLRNDMIGTIRALQECDLIDQAALDVLRRPKLRRLPAMQDWTPSSGEA